MTSTAQMEQTYRARILTDLPHSAEQASQKTPRNIALEGRMKSAHSSHWKTAFPGAILGVAVIVITLVPTLNGEQNRPRVVGSRRSRAYLFRGTWGDF